MKWRRARLRRWHRRFCTSGRPCGGSGPFVGPAVGGETDFGGPGAGAVRAVQVKWRVERQFQQH